MHNVVHTVCLIVIAILLQKILREDWNRGGNSSDTKHVNYEKVLTKNLDSATNPDVKDAIKQAGEIISSVWCHGNNSGDRICLFHNICFHPKADEFIFFSSEDSVVENLPESDVFKSVLDLTSVADHNAHYFSFASLPVSASVVFSVRWSHNLTLALSRFKPDNLMHVLHDDALPLHHTLTLIPHLVRGSGNYDVQVLFLEGWEPGDYVEVYQSFSSQQLLYRQDLLRLNDMMCFSNIYIGIAKSTVWYQYGFHRPQGPVHSLTVTGAQIHKTANFLLQRLPGSSDNRGNIQTDFMILLSRTDNRLILNEAELSQEIANKLKLKVIILNMDLYPLADILHLVSMATGLIGMHGAMMSLIMFLKPGSFVIELFPFGVPAENYTPYKTLSNLPGMGLVYAAWENKYSAKNVAHPHRTAEFGGIEHLSSDKQKMILSETNVRQHLCCSDPSWLFRIYQDTMVTVSEVLTLIAETRKNANNLVRTEAGSSSQGIFKVFPAKVRDVQCRPSLSDSGEISLLVTWKEPWNLKYLPVTQFYYEVLVQVEGDIEHMKYLISNQELVLSDGKYILWIRAVLNEDIPGPFTNLNNCQI